MGRANRVDDQTFQVDFAGDGLAALGERVKDKLKEFMGDYTDDTIVEYVIVMVKNGRRKDEVENELNVFLGNDSSAFVSWLWDHLGSNLDLYAKPSEVLPDEVAKTKSLSVEQAGRIESHQLDIECERAKSSKLSRSHRKREWKGLVRDANETPPFQSSMTNNIHVEKENHHDVSCAKRSRSPMVPKKRNRLDEQRHMKKEVASQTTVDAPQRLLQFAVRDAVATSRPSKPAKEVATSRSSKSAKEPALKRLRSVVSTSAGDSFFEDHPQRIRSAVMVPTAMATAIKAAAEAAKDVANVRSSSNVFDRLGRCVEISDTTDQLAEYRETVVEDGDFEDFGPTREEGQTTFLQRTYYREQHAGNITMMGSDTGMACDSASDNEGYDDVNVKGHGVMDISQIDTSCGNKVDDSRMVQYSVANKADEIMCKPWKDQDQQASVANTSRKIVNISVNVNTWKPPRYQELREVSEMDSRKSLQVTDAEISRSGVQLKENSNLMVAGNENAKPAVDAQRQSQKTLPFTPGSYSTGRPTENADSRTIFVNNVHFAATKDSLSRHFNKFGEVLKVVIVTDAATGQPKGSAYVEFMRKEAAELALSLDGTSFMSRILKVVRKTSAHVEAAPVMTWPRIARGSPFAASRFARGPFPRGIPTLYRPRLPIKPGARSLQWKRDAQSTQTDRGAPVSTNSIPSPSPRGLTYVRAEPKANGNSRTA